MIDRPRDQQHPDRRGRCSTAASRPVARAWDWRRSSRSACAPCPVRVNDVVGVSGFVLPGMKVDVLVTGRPPGDESVVTTTCLQKYPCAVGGGPPSSPTAGGRPSPLKPSPCWCPPGRRRHSRSPVMKERSNWCCATAATSASRRRPAAISSKLYGRKKPKAEIAEERPAAQGHGSAR